MKFQKNKFILILSILLIIFASNFVFAEEITFSADKMNGSTGENSEYSKLSGNAFIKTESMEIRADEIILSGKDFRFINATGNVSGKSVESEFDFSSQQMEYDRETEIAVLKGNVSMIDTKNEINASAQIIEYNQKSEVAYMQIDVKLIQKENTCTGANAIYKKKEQILELSGTPQIVKGKDNFRANEIYMNLETEEIMLDGKVRGAVSDTATEESKE
jgi:lipopolysaccharide export system protein LptA